MDELPTIIEILKSKSESYRKDFYAKAVALEIEAWQTGQIELWRMYGAIADAYQDAFDTFGDIEALELEDFEVMLEVGDEYLSS